MHCFPWPKLSASKAKAVLPCKGTISTVPSTPESRGELRDDPDNEWAGYNPDTDDYDMCTAPVLPPVAGNIIERRQIAQLKSRIAKGGDLNVMSHYGKVVHDMEASLANPSSFCKVNITLPTWKPSGHTRTPSSQSTATSATDSTCIPNDLDEALEMADDIIPQDRPQPPKRAALVVTAQKQEIAPLRFAVPRFALAVPTVKAGSRSTLLLLGKSRSGGQMPLPSWCVIQQRLGEDTRQSSPCPSRMHLM